MGGRKSGRWDLNSGIDTVGQLDLGHGGSPREWRPSLFPHELLTARMGHVAVLGQAPAFWLPGMILASMSFAAVVENQQCRGWV